MHFRTRPRSGCRCIGSGSQSLSCSFFRCSGSCCIGDLLGSNSGCIGGGNCFCRGQSSGIILLPSCAACWRIGGRLRRGCGA
jgi:hypothetical protein